MCSMNQKEFCNELITLQNVYHQEGNSEVTLHEILWEYEGEFPLNLKKEGGRSWITAWIICVSAFVYETGKSTKNKHSIDFLTEENYNSDLSYISIGKVDTDIEFNTDDISKALQRIAVGQKVMSGRYDFTAVLPSEH